MSIISANIKNLILRQRAVFALMTVNFVTIICASCFIYADYIYNYNVFNTADTYIGSRSAIILFEQPLPYAAIKAEAETYMSKNNKHIVSASYFLTEDGSVIATSNPEVFLYYKDSGYFTFSDDKNQIIISAHVSNHVFIYGSGDNRPPKFGDMVTAPNGVIYEVIGVTSSNLYMTDGEIGISLANINSVGGNDEVFAVMFTFSPSAKSNMTKRVSDMSNFFGKEAFLFDKTNLLEKGIENAYLLLIIMLFAFALTTVLSLIGYILNSREKQFAVLRLIGWTKAKTILYYCLELIIYLVFWIALSFTIFIISSIFIERYHNLLALKHYIAIIVINLIYLMPIFIKRLLNFSEVSPNKQFKGAR